MEFRGEDEKQLDRLTLAAHLGTVDRRRFLKTLIAAGVSAVFAAELSEQAAMAADNQRTRRANLLASYDYIVVGAGAAGCVLANRLSANPAVNVLLLEPGSADVDQPKLYDPALWSLNLGSETDWAFTSAPQAGFNGRELPLAAGRVIGGSASINGLAWVRGDAREYLAWERIAGPEWGAFRMISNFHRIESYAGAPDPRRGRHGPIGATTLVADHPLTRPMIEAGREFGLREVAFNAAPLVDGVGPSDLNIRDGRRSGPAQGYLLPVLSRPNLTLLTGVEVMSLIIEGGVCRGVNAVAGDTPVRFRADGEVVLSTGALRSPKLLLQSGVGPADDLRALGIAVHADSPRVGRGLQDGVSVTGVEFQTRQTLPPAVGNGLGCFFYTRTNPGSEGPNLQIISTQFGTGAEPGDSFLLVPCLIKPHSRGELRLTSADPRAPARIDPRCLTAPEDLEILSRGLELTTEIGLSRGLSSIANGVAFPGRLSRQARIAYIRDASYTSDHPTSTCAMGLDHRSVLDPKLRVRGVRGLRVVDASAMPQLPASNIQAPTLMLAENAARLMGFGAI
ncbi:MAG: GMC family oxidoreductase [Lysobacteraceae bacterium]